MQGKSLQGFSCPSILIHDYNVLYANYPVNDVWDDRPNPYDCNWPTPVIPNDYTCLMQQFGGCCVDIVGGEIVLDEAHAIIKDPSFVSMGNDDYHLSNPSQFLGDDGTQRGCYGGSDPLDW